METLKFIFRIPALPVAFLLGLYIGFRIEQENDPAELELNEDAVFEKVDDYIDQIFPVWLHNSIAIAGWFTILNFII